MSTTTQQDAYRDAIALCHEWPDSEGSVTQDEPFIYVKIRNPYQGLLLEDLIRNHGFMLSSRTRIDGQIVLFA